MTVHLEGSWWGREVCKLQFPTSFQVNNLLKHYSLVLDVDKQDRWSIVVVQANKESTTIGIRAVEDIFSYADTIRAAASSYMSDKVVVPTTKSPEQ